MTNKFTELSAVKYQKVSSAFLKKGTKDYSISLIGRAKGDFCHKSEK